MAAPEEIFALWDAILGSWLPVTQKGTPLNEWGIPGLRPLLSRGKLKDMKRVVQVVAAILVGIVALYLWSHRGEYRILRTWLPTRQAEGVILNGNAKDMEWRPVDESAQGFKVEMPGEPRSVVVQASNETGSTEPVSMLLVKPDSDRTYAIAWADKPPVARMNDLVPDKTLDQARDGALNRTNTTLVSEIRSNPQGFPGRDVVAHNVGGGVLDTRFIYAGSRLYMLIATAPSVAARHEDEIIRFFNSFAINNNSQIPETLPAATR